MSFASSLWCSFFNKIREKKSSFLDLGRKLKRFLMSVFRFTVVWICPSFLVFYSVNKTMFPLLVFYSAKSFLVETKSGFAHNLTLYLVLYTAVFDSHNTESFMVCLNSWLYIIYCAVKYVIHEYVWKMPG